ncbi:protein FAM118A [Pelodytes ibericus]
MNLPRNMMNDVSRKIEVNSRKTLKTLTNKNPSDLLIVLGTGVSAAAAPGIPALGSWRSCLEAIIQAAAQLDVLHPADVAEFKRKTQKEPNLLVVAHDLIRKLSPRTGVTKPNFFQDCLLEVFENLENHIQNPVVLESIISLMDRGALVLTTNYDNLLEMYGQKQGKAMESLDLSDKVKVLLWSRGHNKYGVLHIHGIYTNPCDILLHPAGYKEVMQDLGLMAELQNLYRTKSFLFLGCGETLRDQIFQALFLDTVQNKWNLQHYMLVHKENEDRFFKLQVDLLLNGIKLMTYGETLKNFPEYLRGLALKIASNTSSELDYIINTSALLFAGKTMWQTYGTRATSSRAAPRLSSEDRVLGSYDLQALRLQRCNLRRCLRASAIQLPATSHQETQAGITGFFLMLQE